MSHLPKMMFSLATHQLSVLEDQFALLQSLASFSAAAAAAACYPLF